MRYKTLMVLVVSSATLIACSANDPAAEEVTSDSTRSESTSDSPTIDSEPDVLASFNESTTISDVDDYQFELEVDHQIVGLQDDAAGDKPGATSIYMDISTDVELMNQTEGRQITFEPAAGLTGPIGTPTFFLVTGWEHESVICQTLPDPGYVEDFSCAIIVAYWQVDQSLEPSGTLTPEVFNGLDSGLGEAGLSAVPEDDAEDVETALLDPDFYLVGYAGGDWSRFQETCPGDGLDSLSGTGYKLVYSSTDSCEKYRPLTQPASP